MQDGLADRAEEQTGEASASAGADDDELGVPAEACASRCSCPSRNDTSAISLPENAALMSTSPAIRASCHPWLAIAGTSFLPQPGTCAGAGVVVSAGVTDRRRLISRTVSSTKRMVAAAAAQMDSIGEGPA